MLWPLDLTRDGRKAATFFQVYKSSMSVLRQNCWPLFLSIALKRRAISVRFQTEKRKDETDAKMSPKKESKTFQRQLWNRIMKMRMCIRENKLPRPSKVQQSF